MIIAASKPVKVNIVASTPPVTTKTIGGKVTPPPTTPVTSQPTNTIATTSNTSNSNPVTPTPTTSTPQTSNTNTAVSGEEKKDIEYYLKKYWYVPAGLTMVIILNRKFKWF